MPLTRTSSDAYDTPAAPISLNPATAAGAFWAPVGVCKSRPLFVPLHPARRTTGIPRRISPQPKSFHGNPGHPSWNRGCSYVILSWLPVVCFATLLTFIQKILLFYKQIHILPQHKDKAKVAYLRRKPMRRSGRLQSDAPEKDQFATIFAMVQEGGVNGAGSILSY